MSLIINNTEVDDVIFNNTSVDTVIYNGVTVWERVVSLDTVITATRMDSNVYIGSSTYSNCSFIAFQVKTGDEAGSVVFGNLTKNIPANTTQTVYFGNYPHDGSTITDDGTPITGDITLYNIKGLDMVTFNSAKSTTKICKCIERIKNWGGLTQIGGLQTFSGFFSNLITPPTSVSLGKFITVVGPYVFTGCSSLTTLVIPASVQDLGYNDANASSGLPIFKGADNLTNISVSANNQYFSVRDGALLSKNGDTLYYLPSNINATSFNMSGIKILQAYAYRPNHTLNGTILNNIEVIKSVALGNLTNISVLNLPNIKRLERWALSSGTISSSILAVGATLYLGSTLTSIVNKAVAGENIGSLIIGGSIPYTNDDSSPGVNGCFTHLGYNTTNGCTITFNSVLDIPDYAFNSGYAGSEQAADVKPAKIRNIIGAENIRNVGKYAFNATDWSNYSSSSINFSGLQTLGDNRSFASDAITNSSIVYGLIPSTTKVYFGSSFTRVVGRAQALSTFRGAEVHFLGTTPPSIQQGAEHAFELSTNTIPADWKIYVPNSALSSYQMVWSSYSSYMVGE